MGEKWDRFKEKAKKWETAAQEAQAKQLEYKIEKYKARCPKCKSDNITFSVEDIKHKRGMLARGTGVVGKTLFAPATLGLSFFIPTGKKRSTFRVATCNNCGKQWSQGKMKV